MEFVKIDKDSCRFRCSVRRFYDTVYNQKSEGICLPIAMATATTIAYRIKYGYMVDFSPQPLIDLGIFRFKDAKKYITNKNFGLQQHCDYPFVHIKGKLEFQTSHRYTLYDVKLVSCYKKIKDAIKTNFGQLGPK